MSHSSHCNEISSWTFASLPEEIQDIVLDEAAMSGLATFGAIRLVCVRFCKILGLRLTPEVVPLLQDGEKPAHIPFVLRFLERYTFGSRPSPERLFCDLHLRVENISQEGGCILASMCRWKTASRIPDNLVTRISFPRAVLDNSYCALTIRDLAELLKRPSLWNCEVKATSDLIHVPIYRMIMKWYGQYLLKE